MEHNPIKLLHKAQISNDDDLSKRTDIVFNQFTQYLKERNNKKEIVYYCCEYGIHESFPNYSGGLGILAGDHLKSSSDQKLNIVAIGLLYRNGYFNQAIESSGKQKEEYNTLNFESLPLTLCCNPNKEPIKIEVELPDRTLKAQIWQANVGSIPLYLLDADINLNTPQNRKITDALYSGDRIHRIEQELLLGIGGVRILNALDIHPKVHHINEGHAAFSTLERLCQIVESGSNFDEALEKVRQSTVFTTHTPVPAGNELFSDKLMKEYLWNIVLRLGIHWEDFIKMGKINLSEKEFGMTIFALKTSSMSNGVSKLHGEVSRSMWREVWPDKKLSEIPIDHITNGVHLPSWISKSFCSLYNKVLTNNWINQSHLPETWKKIDSLSSESIKIAKKTNKRKLIDFIRNIEHKRVSNGQSIYSKDEINQLLSDNILTIGFARRFATYKRATLLLSDIERLKKIVNNIDKPIQFLFSGKAHPKDEPGKNLIRNIIKLTIKHNLKNRIVFIENYNIDIGRLLVQGVDVWLNNPRRPHEASGTSGMKVPINGGLNCSILDGWWAEVYNSNIGWAIGDSTILDDYKEQDKKDQAFLYSTLYNISDTYYEASEKWYNMVKASIKTCCPIFHTDRMVLEYSHKYYDLN